MKINIDTKSHVITVEENVNLGELVKHLEMLLPKNHVLGHWKTFTLQTNVVINTWNNPIYVPPYHHNWYEVTCDTIMGNSPTTTNFCIELN